MQILKEGGIFELISPVVNYINDILTNLVPNGEKYLVLLVSFIIAYGMKSKNNWNNFTMIIFTIVFYSFFRYIGLS